MKISRYFFFFFFAMFCKRYKEEKEREREISFTSKYNSFENVD